MFGRREFLAGAAALGLVGKAGASVLTGGAADRAVDAFLKTQPFQGVVLIGRAGKPIYARTVGFAEIEARKPAALDTPYVIASISKWLTSTALLKLVEAGKLDLDAPISTWLPDYRADTGTKVKLRHLMTNISGVPNGFATWTKANPDPDLFQKTFTTAEAVKLWCSGDLIFEPGTRFDYVLTNWILITAIIETVTGEAYAQAMSELVLGPLGLTRTTPTDPANMAVSYRTLEPLTRQRNDRFPFMAASGGYVSTAGDLLKAAHAILDGGFLAPASKKALLTVGWPDQDYALGGRVKSLFADGMPRVFAWETGRAAGYRSVLGHRFDDQTTVVLLNNTSISQKAMDDFAYSLFGTV
ncbi:serine hydrolase [Caulobacter sp. 602-1]|uniref:serine hydrolase domain-containing protein n=1 Tax=Caulobacter sp. 602-1 TaxID=2492472 RepID=UPI000F63D7FE|nr:serine hydrolase domain-containing protein [Caulobacter sp. 602-1]RRN65493.1 class A beta-lactamase-related serine hydrolase [Caulobacter sp. 602-1]